MNMYYFIINPASGSGKGLAIWKTVQSELDRLHVDYSHFLLRGPGEGTALARSLSTSHRPCTLVAVGGDGTINEIINGLGSFENITFACIPTGSGNDFVRGLGLTRDPLDALHRILSPSKYLHINIGQLLINGEPSPRNFAVSSGAGFDAAVCYSVDSSALKTALNRFHSGKLVYLLTSLWLLFTMERLTLSISIDDGEPAVYEKSYFTAAMNLQYEGGGFRFCPDASPDDDMLDLIVVNGISRFHALCLLPLSLFGKHIGHSGIHVFRCRKAAIKSTDRLCFHTDGEIRGFSGSALFSLCEKKLAVILR